MAWILLVVAGVLETGWAIGLKYTQGFTRPLPTTLTVVAIALSMTLLGLAARHLPIGTAYAVWVAIGAAGTVLLGAFLFQEPLGWARLAFLALLLVAVIGLKVTSGA